MSTTQYVVCKENAGTYGLGEEVAPNCLLFRSGDYGLTKEEVDRRLAAKSNQKTTQEKS